MLTPRSARTFINRLIFTSLLHFVFIGVPLYADTSKPHPIETAMRALEGSPSIMPRTNALALSASRRGTCGLNALYLFLRLRGVDVSYDSVRSAVGPTHDGNSLLELSNVAQELGLDAQVVKCKITDFDYADFPVIAHWNNDAKNGIRGDGHYVVVLELGSARVTYIDGTTGELFSHRQEWADRLWSGYFLVAKRNVSGFIGIVVIALTVACLPVCRWFIKRWQVVSSSRRLLVPIVACALAIGLTTPVRADASPMYRSAEHDGWNCLYLLGRVLGVPVRYSELTGSLDTSQRQLNLLDLKTAARRLGLSVDVVQARTGAYLPNVPAIVQYQDPDSAGASFVLVYYADETTVAMIHGGQVVYQEISAADFRRNWTGFALVRREFTAVPAAICTIAVIGCCAGHYWVLRLRGIRRNSDAD